MTDIKKICKALLMILPAVSYADSNVTISGLPGSEAEDRSVCYDSSTGLLGNCHSISQVPFAEDGEGSFIGTLVGVHPNSNKISLFTEQEYVVFVGQKKGGVKCDSSDHVKGLSSRCVLLYTESACAGRAYVQLTNGRVFNPGTGQSLHYTPADSQFVDVVPKSYRHGDTEECVKLSLAPLFSVTIAHPNDPNVTGIDPTLDGKNYKLPIRLKRP